MKESMQRAMIALLCLAVWTALVGAAAPRPKGPLVYSDDFSDPAKSGLEDNVNATDYSRGFHAPGVYHLRLLQPNDTRWSLFPGKSYNQVTVQLDVWDNSDDFQGDVSQGVILRAQDSAHFYAVLVDSRKGQYAVRKQDGSGNWSDLIAWTPSALIKQQNQVNHLQVDGDNDSFTVSLNDEVLATFKDSAYSRGGIGLIASNVDADKPHIHYDNVKIYSADVPSSSLPGTGDPGWLYPLLAAMTALLLIATGLLVRCARRPQDRDWLA